jgi:hypothetical protein
MLFDKLSSFNWLGSYLKQAAMAPFQPAAGLKHILFLFVDHFEVAGKNPRLSEWMTRYPLLASRHLDADGRFPQHTWFYALDLIREEELAALRNLVEKEYGEIELHWHHHYETADSFQTKLRQGLTIFQKYGYMRPIKQDTMGCFGFIHGNWSLDNSCGDASCGVDNEIELLQKAGCYGDFTFPALHSKAQPPIINSIYYCKDDGKPASYFKGQYAQVGKRPAENEFMIFEGPLTVNWYDWRFIWHPTIENGEVGGNNSHDLPKRIDSWVRQNIHVNGRPEWIFVKIFCHGGQDYNAVLGDSSDRMFSYLENKYNDGVNYSLHYITAREGYNIVKAAEDGKSGNPNQYRDYIIPHPFSR